MIISQTMTDMVQFTIAIRWKVKNMGFQMAYLYLTLTHSKWKGYRHVHFDSEYLGNGVGRRYECHEIERHVRSSKWHR